MVLSVVIATSLCPASAMAQEDGAATEAAVVQQPLSDVESDSVVQPIDTPTPDESQADEPVTPSQQEAETSDDDVVMGDEDITLYPKMHWGYWLSFNSDGGTYVDSKFILSGQRVTEPAGPTNFDHA